MASPLLEQVKLQAQVLVPVLRAFREELGAEPANRIAWQALAKWRQQLVRELAKDVPGHGVDRWAQHVVATTEQVGDAIDVEFLTQEPEAMDFNITGCRFAQFFRELGEPELGFALLCALDGTVAEELGEGDVKLTRTGTIMQGASHCDFRYRLRRAGVSTP
jgi:hypothetical protein